MKSKHKTLKLTLIAALALVLTSCSSYFSAGMSGSVTDKETGNPISNVLVCAYTDAGARDSAFNSYTYSYDKEFFGNTATFRTHTAANGTFSIKSIKWNTTNPEYGKDGDNQTIYPLFFHKDYGLVKGNPFVITSDSINEGANQTLEKIREEKTITINVVDPSNNSTSYTDEYSFDVVEKAGDENDSDVQIKQLGDTNQFVINYKKGGDVPALAVVNYKNRNQEGHQNTKQCLNDENLTFCTEDNLKEIDLQFNPNTKEYYLYAKPIKFAYPIINGRVTSSDDKISINKEYGTEDDNNIRVWAATDNEGKNILGNAVYTKQTVYGDNSQIITNGTFSINLSTETYIDDAYLGKFPTEKTIYIVYPNKANTDVVKEIKIDGKAPEIRLVLTRE